MRLSVVLTVGVAVVLMSTSARAQGRTFVASGIGGTFNATSAPVVQVTAGAAMGPYVQIVGEFTYMDDVLPPEVRDELENVARGFESFSRIVLGETIVVDVEANARVLSGAVGVRMTPWQAKLKPFVQADVGFAHVNPTIKFLSGGQDITNSVVPPIGGAEVKPALGFGGGITVALGARVSAEARYEFTRVFTEQAFDLFRIRGVNANTATVGVVVTF